MKIFSDKFSLLTPSIPRVSPTIRRCARHNMMVTPRRGFVWLNWALLVYLSIFIGLCDLILACILRIAHAFFTYCLYISTSAMD
jgi:hypothetical protein